MSTKPIKKAIFPVAGLGTRFLPATKASPKEMLPIVDKPLIQYAVEEAIDAGCTEMVFVTGRNKRSIEDHFDKAYELETELAMRHKDKLLEHVRDILPPDITCLYIRQAEALGLGHAVLCARAAVNEGFAQGLLHTVTLETVYGHAVKKLQLPENENVVQFYPRQR